MQLIENEEARRLLNLGEAAIIDVRERAEFRKMNFDGSINFLSSSFEIQNYFPFQRYKIYLRCQLGNRSRKVAENLENEGFSQVFLLENQMDRISVEKYRQKGWSIDRQFRITLGILLLIFLLGYKVHSSSWIITPVILCTGLIFTSIIDRCDMRMGIALLPWNRGKKG